MDEKKRSVLVLLDLTAAFYSIDHNIIINRLNRCVGLSCLFLQWFTTYLSGRDFIVSTGDNSSVKGSLTREVPHGPTLGPLVVQSVHAVTMKYH